MSLALAAQHLQSKGRGNDTHLVHMTSGELQSLRNLAKAHGSDLTTNPETGLPEAGLLGNILPMVLGGVGAAMGIPVWALAPAIGMADYAITGSLGQGIMAGLGAWGGSGLYGNIAEFGANPNNLFNAQETLAQSAPQVEEASGAAVNGLDASYSAAPNYAINPATHMQPGINPQITAPATTQAGGYTGPDFGQGLKNLFAHPIDYLTTPGYGLNAAATLGPVAIGAFKGLLQPEAAKPEPQKSNIPESSKLKYISPDFKATLPEPPTPYATVYPNYLTNPYTAKNGGLMDIDRYASKGLVDLDELTTSDKKKALLEAEKKAIEDINKGAAMFKRPVKEMPAVDPGLYIDKDPSTANLSSDQAAAYNLSRNALLAQMPESYSSGISKFPTLGSISTAPVVPTQYSHGGNTHGLPNYNLGDYSDGGRLLKGPGDGVSDSIPATIGHKQPARLADGEFVIPARIVSELGNGSTDAGAKRLYDMMDRIKAKRAKAKDIAADTKAYKLLPA